VEALVAGHFDQLERDGGSGRLSSHELKKALKAYGRTVITIPDEAFDFVDIYPIQGQKSTWAVDVPLWTAEEGRSDVTLSLTVSEAKIACDWRLMIFMSYSTERKKRRIRGRMLAPRGRNQ
jgi:hypothetical protein